MTISNSCRQSLRRWRSIIALAVIGAVTFEFSLAVGWYYIREVSLLQDWFAAWFLRIGIFGTLLTLAIVFAEPIRFRARHLRRLHLYPPLWTSVVIGIGCAFLLDAGLQPLEPALIPSWRQLDILLPLTAIAALAVALRQPPRRRKSPPEPISSLPIPPTWKIIREWSLREEALTHGPDLLRHEPIADRIHDALIGSQERAIALIGPIGCGKTSILNMVSQRLRNVSGASVVIADINCWSMPRTEDAPRIALEGAIGALNDVVDTQALRGLPETYLRILAAEPTGTIAKTLGNLPTTDAATELRRLTPVLEAIDAKLLLVIEDAERAAHPFETKHLERLLWALRDIPRVTFVLSFDAERAGFDYTKLCDHIERVPPLSVEFVEDMLAPAYEHWRTVKDGHLDPLPDARDDTLGLRRVTHPIVRYSRRLEGTGVADAVTELVTSPRNLKHFIRGVNGAWEALQGEVELDDLIVLTALRHGEPKAFNFILANVDAAKSESNEGDVLAGTAQKTVRARWERLRDSLTNPEAVQILVDALQLEQLTSKSSVGRQSSPQGIHRDGPTDYLGRILAGRIAPGEIRDQEVLGDIADWKTSGTGRMFERLLDSTSESDRYVAVWEHYDGHFTENQLMEIATRLVGEVLSRYGANASMNAPAMLATWRCCKSRVPSAVRTNWLIEKIRLVLPTSLGLANEFFRYWASVPSGNVSEDERNRARGALVEQARVSFVTAKTLLASLGPKHDYALTSLVHPEQTNEPPDPVASNSWGWLVPHIIDAARMDEDRIVPDVITLVLVAAAAIRSDRPYTRYELNREKMAEFFGDQTEAMLDILADHSGNEESTRAAREGARAWIDELSKGSAGG